MNHKNKIDVSEYLAFVVILGFFLWGVIYNIFSNRIEILDKDIFNILFIMPFIIFFICITIWKILVKG